MIRAFRYLNFLGRILDAGRKRPGALPYKLALSVTNRCDSRCLVCGVWKKYIDLPGELQDEFTAAEWDDFFRKNGRLFSWVAITGGEPFLRDDLEGIVSSCVRRCPGLILLSIVTNGYNTEKIAETTERILKKSGKVQVYVIVSVDSYRETHEHIRQKKGGFDNAMRTLERLEELRRRFGNLKIRLETVISRFNIDSTLEFIDSPLISTHRSSFAFAQESDRYFNQGSGVSMSGLTAARIAPVLEKLVRKTPVIPLEQIILKLFYALSLRYFANPGRQVLRCAAGTASVFVGPYGEVRPCIMMPEAGRLRDHDNQLANLMRSAPMARSLALIADDRCAHCWTPCEAMQTIIQHLPTALKGAGSSNMKLRQAERPAAGRH